MSIVVLTDIIAILLTPGIFLIHIFNTNMYLIHFYIKKILNEFSEQLGFNTSNSYISFIIHHYIRDEINCVGISKDFSIECNIIYMYINFILNENF